MKHRLLAAACIFILCAILTAGLWPFNPYPPNEVSWLRNGNGVRFGESGTMFSARAFGPIEPSPCTVEVWLQPAVASDTNTILAFYTPENPLQFRLNQYGDNLALSREVRSQRDPNSEVWIEHAFRGRKLLFITISSDTRETEVFIDGVVVKKALQFGLSTRDFSGQLVLGTSPVAYATWAGDLRGLALYGRAFTSAEALRHYRAWTEDRTEQLPDDKSGLAFYRFDERRGRIAHNLVASGADLDIPYRFTILHKVFLDPPWKEFHLDRDYLKDVMINVGGFIPLGFFFFIYLRTVYSSSRAASIAILVGAVVSLTIEILQGYIPSRSSGMTDVITNTAGTGVGVALARSKVAQTLLSKARMKL